jgi:hypothetical protein
VLGAIGGDIMGSTYQFDGMNSKDFPLLFGAGAFFTDDSVCTVAVADCIYGLPSQ